MASTLVVFDCDDTLVEGSVEFHAITIAPDDLVETLTTMIDEKDSPETMDCAMGELYRNGHGRQAILERVSSMYVYPEMVDVVEKIRKRQDVDMILLSGANDVMINAILGKVGILDAFKRVITNPAHFDDNGRLHITSYHTHDCTDCAGLCKGAILREILSKGSYQRVIFVGDGDNDVCPSKCLSERDHVIARELYPLAEELSELANNSRPIGATVHTADFKSDEVEQILFSLLDLEAVRKILFVFDFDYTLVDGNTDTHVFDVAPELEVTSRYNDLRRRFPCWPLMIDHVMGEIHSSGHSKEEVVTHMKRMTFCSGMLEAVKVLSTMSDVEMIVLSDSNTVFIGTLLESVGLSGAFSCVMTNPAHFDQDGRLCIGCYHSHACQRCHRTPNLCKGTALKEVLAERSFSKIVYIGDGGNDVCPSMVLSEGDHVVARDGYTLAKRLKELSNNGSAISASVHIVDFNSDKVKPLILSFMSA